MQPTRVKRLVLSALFLALCMVLPFLTGQIPDIGSMLLPMHIPVLLCGLLCGWRWGMVVGATAPVLRSLIFTMPPLYPVALAMAVEMAVYGAVIGLLFGRLPRRGLTSLYACLISAMLAGRLAWGGAQLLLLGLGGKSFTVAAFFAGAVTSALPGIVLQLVLIPALMLALEKMHAVSLHSNT